MTIERHDPEAGIKIVPMFIEGEDEPTEEDVAPVERVKTPLLGIVGLFLGALTVAALIAGIVIASVGDWSTATIVAYAAMGLSVLALVGGVAAVVLGLGRRWGVIAVLLGVLANPLVLLVVLRFFGGLEVG